MFKACPRKGGDPNYLHRMPYGKNKNRTFADLSCFEFWSFGFRICLEFRNSDLEFNIINVSFYKTKRYQYQANLSSAVVVG